MATVTAPHPTVEADRSLTLFGLDWKAYLQIAEALPTRHNPRLIYLDGRLTFVVTSRLRDYFAECLGDLVKGIAHELGINWEPAGQATFRDETRGGGVEGDRTYYFGEHAAIMKGPVNIDLTTQPPPDLAIEVEVSNPADRALEVWGRRGVPEVWRFDPNAWTFGFWLRRDDGTYAQADRGLAFPALEAADVIAQMRRIEEVGTARWFSELAGWVRDVLRPRVVGRP